MLSIEQVLAWAPDTIITWDPNSRSYASDRPGADRPGRSRPTRVFLAPRLPFAGSTRRPIHRIIGCAVIQGCSIRKKFTRTSGRARAPSSGFFIQLDLSDEQLDRLLAGAQPGHRGAVSCMRGDTAALVLLLGSPVAALLWGSPVGPYQLSLADVFHAAAARLPGFDHQARPYAGRARDRVRPCCRLTRVCRRHAGGRRGSRRRHHLSDAVSQSAGVTRHPRRRHRGRPGRWPASCCR